MVQTEGISQHSFPEVLSSSLKFVRKPGTEAAVELLSSRLWWSAEGPSAGIFDTVNTKIISVEELCDLEYSIPHYSQKSLGCAYGPCGLDRILQFCSELHHFVECHEKVLLTYPLHKVEKHTNAAVFVGAYLILWLQWSSSKVAQVMGTQHANVTFPCSWLQFRELKSKGVLRTRDCWEGLEQAVKHGWLDPLRLKNRDSLEQFVSQYKNLAFQFDGSWVVPGFIFVCADPVSTALDPNPITFSRLFPPDKVISLGEPSIGIMPGVLPADSPDSCATVCKSYCDPDSPTLSRPAKSQCNKDFSTLLKDLGVKLLVRTNHSSEPGLAKSYNGQIFKDVGIDHLSVPMPDSQDIKEQEMDDFLKQCQLHLDDSQGAIAIHCKGGFGRSICCASKLISLHYSISGRALLGWLRIVRPGAVNTPGQEMFICSLNNPGPETLLPDEDCAQAQPKCTCSVM